MSKTYAHFSDPALARPGVSPARRILLIRVMTIAVLVGSMILQMMISYQSRILVEVSRNDLQDRAEHFLIATVGQRSDIQQPW